MKGYLFSHTKRLQDWYLDYDPWDLGLQMHQTDCEPVLEKMGIDYDPEGKYKLDKEIKKATSHAFVKV